MSIRCAHCKSYHDSIQEVKVCAGIVPGLTPAFSGQPRSGGQAVATAPRPAVSTRQQSRSGDWELLRALRRSLPDLEHAYYAVEHEGVLKFYRVDKPQEGKWKGYTFIKVQASDDLHRIGKAQEELVLEAIAKDPQEAMLRYGREIGRCGHCGRTLTNKESREYGIGPVCREKMAW